MKCFQDNLFKGFLLNSIGEGYNTLASLDEHLSGGVFDYKFEIYDIETSKFVHIHFKENYSKYDGIRRELQYLRGAYFIKMYGDKKPFFYELTEKGKIHAKNPFINKNFKNEEWSTSVRETIKVILEDDEKIEELSEKKRIEKCKSCRDAKPNTSKSKTKNTARPIKNIIKVELKNGDIREIEMTKDGEIMELEELKKALILSGKSPNAPSTILTLQNENEELRKLLGKSGIELGKANTKLERKDRKNEKTMQRQYYRHEIAEAYWADENGNAYPLSQEFFDLWGGDYMAVVLEKVLEFGQIFEAGKVDVLSRGSEMYQRRKKFIRRELVGDEIYQQGFYIQEIKSSGIIIDSDNMIAPKLLKW